MAQMFVQASGSLVEAEECYGFACLRRSFGWTVLAAVNILRPLQAQVAWSAYESW